MTRGSGPNAIAGALAGVLVAGSAACGGQSSHAPASTAPAAKVENPKPEGELTTVNLTAEAQAHLALQTVQASMDAVRSTRALGGEAIVPPGRMVVVSAPVAGTLREGRASAGVVRRGQTLFELVPLQQPERDVRPEAERALREANARQTQATQRADRLRQLLKDGSASARSVEEAEADRTVAAAAAEAARKRLESIDRLPLGPGGEMALTAPIDGYLIALRAAPGQTVAAGAPVAEIAQTSGLWIRVPVYAGDVASIDTSAPADVAILGQETSGPWRTAPRVSGPPAADPGAASVDLYFAVPDGLTLRPGERVSVRLPLQGAERAIVVPASALVYDPNGGTWVYEQRSARQYARRRVEVGGRAGSNVVIRRGLREGMTIVSVGAAELYGTEFFVTK